MLEHRVSLLDVARVAHVSRGAAGKVLNGGSAGIGVGAAARARILEAAEKLGYRSNMAATILAGGSSKLLGVLMDSYHSFRSYRLLQEIERFSQMRGYHVMTSFTHDNIDAMYENYQMMRRYSPCGIICGAHDYGDLKSDVLRYFSSAEDLVFLEPPFLENKPYVATDRTPGLTGMVREALRQGHRQLGLLCGNTKWHTEKRLVQEFSAALEANGLQLDEHLVFEFLDPQTCRHDHLRNDQFNQKLCAMKPDFLYVDSAPSAVALQTRLHKLNMQVDIYGGDLDPVFDAMNLPSLDPHYEKIAEALVDMAISPGNSVGQRVVDAEFVPVASGAETGW